MTLSEFSRATGTIGEMAPLCPGDPVLKGAAPPVTNIGPFAVSFGLTYTGDQGVEPGTTTTCIFESKVDWLQFNIEQDLLKPFEGVVNDSIHKAIDRATIATVFGAANTPDGRCARWRPLP